MSFLNTAVPPRFNNRIFLKDRFLQQATWDIWWLLMPSDDMILAGRPIPSIFASNQTTILYGNRKHWSRYFQRNDNIHPTAERKTGKPQKQANLKKSRWLDGQSGSMHGTEHIAENIAGPEKQRYLALLPDWPENLLSKTGCYQTDWKREEEIIPVKTWPIHTSRQLFLM